MGLVEWTDPAIDWTGVDALEVWGVVDDGHTCEPCHGDETPNYWSVYTHRAGEGVMCVADRGTRAEALNWAYGVACPRMLPVVDFSNKPGA